MIDVIRTYAYCIDDISKIENYSEAVSDTETWICHHKLELHDDYINTVEDLIKMNLYFHRPAEELIFLKRKAHTHIHNMNKVRNRKIGETFGQSFLGKHHSEETRAKISAKAKGRKLGPFSEEHRRKLSEAAKRRKTKVKEAD